jgi:hypothetical protein
VNHSPSTQQGPFPSSANRRALRPSNVP